MFLAEIVDIHTSSGGTYGSPRVHAMLARRSIAAGRTRVDRVMRGARLQGAFLPETMAARIHPYRSAGCQTYATSHSLV